MATVSTVHRTKYPTIADVQARIGDVPVERILSYPAPGTATEADLLDNSITGGRPCELVDGILVEEAVGFRYEYAEMRIALLIAQFLEQRNLGAVVGSQGPVRFRPGLVRMPDVSFIRWDSVDDTDEIEEPDGAFLEVPPDLAVEVLSPSNTRKEMDIKLAEYAKAGVRLVWYVDPDRKEVKVYPKGKERGKKVVGLGGVLDGGDVLPGFALPVAKIFEKRAPAKKGGRKAKPGRG
jgi:Uma2 family endonuclease